MESSPDNIPQASQVFVSADERVTLKIDWDAFDFSITTKPGFNQKDYWRMALLAESFGLIVPDDEWPTMNDDGSLCTALVPEEPVDDLAEQNGHAENADTRKWRPLGATMALIGAAAAFLPHALDAAQILPGVAA